MTRSYLDDPAFPCLALALDTRQMVGFLTPLLVDEDHWSISGCRLERLRYRKGVRCILHYEVTLRHESGAETSHWVTGFFHADQKKFNSRVKRLHRMCSRRVHGEPMARFAVLDALGMLIQRFPVDYRLPDVVRITEGLHHLLEDHCPDLFGPGNWRLQTLAVQPVRWRVGISAVVRARIAAVNQECGREVERDFYVKVDSSEVGTVEEIPPRMIDARAERRELPFNTAHAVYTDSEHGLSVTASVAGISLLNLLAEQRATRDEAVQLAETLANWQLHGESLKKCVRAGDKKLHMDRARTILAAACPHQSEVLDTIISQFRNSVIDHVHRPAHLDLKPDHVFYADGQIALIDLDSAADADPALEVGRLLARLAFAEPLYNVNERCARRFAVQFLATYRAMVPGEWLRNLPAYYAWCCMQVAVHVFEHQKVGWSGWIELLLTHAEEASRKGGAALAWLEEQLPNRSPRRDARATPNHALIAQEIFQ